VTALLATSRVEFPEVQIITYVLSDYNDEGECYPDTYEIYAFLLHSHLSNTKANKTTRDSQHHVDNSSK